MTSIEVITMFIILLPPAIYLLINWYMGYRETKNKKVADRGDRGKCKPKKKKKPKKVRKHKVGKTTVFIAFMLGFLVGSLYYKHYNDIALVWHKQYNKYIIMPWFDKKGVTTASTHVERLVRGYGHCTAFRVKYGSKYYTVSNEHCCGKREEHIVGTSKETVIFTDKYHDICVLTNHTNAGLVLATEQPSVGDPVLAIGYPSRSGKTVTAGWVRSPRSGVKVQGKYYMTMRTKLEIHGGNSGSPLLDKNLNVVGIVFATNKFYPVDSLSIPITYLVRALSSYEKRMEERKDQDLRESLEIIDDLNERIWDLCEIPLLHGTEDVFIEMFCEEFRGFVPIYEEEE